MIEATSSGIGETTTSTRGQGDASVCGVAAGVGTVGVAVDWLVAGTRCPDITLDAANFSQLSLGIRRVLITENEINFLALPQAPGTLAIFGSGYGWEALAPARWLDRCAIHYWGDIDTHGFAILDQLRGHFGHVQSLLMDRATLEAHRAFWGREDQPQRADLHRLTPEEGRLYDDLRDNRLGDQLRLEQEQLGFDWVIDAIRRLPHVSARAQGA